MANVIAEVQIDCAGDEWFENVRHWRRSEIREPQVWFIDREGRAIQRQTTEAL